MAQPINDRDNKMFDSMTYVPVSRSFHWVICAKEQPTF